MARETLPVALDLMFGHEGGYVNIPRRYRQAHPCLLRRAHGLSPQTDESKMPASRQPKPNLKPGQH